MTPAASEILIATALDKVAAHVELRARGMWAFALMNGRPFEARANLDGGWLVLDAALECASQATATAAQAWDLLEHNASLAGGARLALVDASAVQVRADIPLDAEVDLGGRIREACRGFEAAKTRLGGGWTAASEDLEDDPASASHQDLAETCQQTGWSVRQRDAGTLAVDLDVPGGFYSATIVSGVDRVAASVPLLDEAAASAEPSHVCRRALAILLLRTSGAVRMVRAAAAAGVLAVPRFEVPFAGPPSAAELSHAFGALTVACRIAGREALVLRHDETVAALYVRRWIANQQQKNQQQKED